MITAGIDIGTNTVRLIVAEILNGKLTSILHQNRAVTRLGEGFINTGKLSEAAIKRTADFVIVCYKEALKWNPYKIKCCATSAVRESPNGQDFVSLLEKEGINVEIIDGEHEGKLTALGVMAAFDLKEEVALIIDIGGGSTEFILWDGKDVALCKSFKIGVVKLSDTFNFHGVCSDTCLKEVTNYLHNFFNDFTIDIPFNKIIATAGTPTTLAAIDMQMEVYDYKKVNGYIITKDRLHQLIKTLSSLTFEERKHIKGLEKGREDLIIPGSLMLAFFLEKFAKDYFLVSDFGLREGIAIAASL
ncbi:MAG: Ppx/GppA family phosphatase [Calditerrivibrio sp.]|nr:Ppx/GppA family phosphatase [Calditerrivibrio sp.]